MTSMRAMTASALEGVLVGERAPLLLDVRRRAAREASARVMPAARWCDPSRLREWLPALPAGARVVACCVHGHSVSQMVASTLRAHGIDALHLAGGIEGWIAAGGVTLDRAASRIDATRTASRWVAAERPGVDVLAAAWLVRRFVDRDAELHFVETDQVEAVAAEMEGERLHPGVPPEGDGDAPRVFESLLRRFDLAGDPLWRVAGLLRDAAEPCGATASPALAVLLRGMTARQPDDLALAAQAALVLDALHAGVLVRAEAAA